MSRRIHKKDLGLGIGAILLSVLVYILSASFSGTAIFFPRFVAACIAIVGVLIAVDGIRGKGAPKKKAEREEPEYLRVLLIVALLIVYYFAFRYLGYVIPTFLLIVVGAYILQYKNLKISIIVGMCMSIGLYLLFSEVFSIRFPGIFF